MGINLVNVVKNMLEYYWSKLLKRLPGSSKKNVILEKPAKIEPRSTVLNSSFGRYSYCGYNCTIINAQIGRFTSISDNVVIGNATHPLNWVSTSPAFYTGKDSVPKDLASLNYDFSSELTIIGNDVWIGERAMIKGGVSIGNGAVIGMGSVVTKDIPDYAIVAGIPARILRYRFDEDIISKMKEIKWWDMDPHKLKEYSDYMNNASLFINVILGKNK